jgi:hypothetical protein
MSELPVRLLLLLNTIVPLLLFMASVYLALHMIVARLITTPGSPVLWFFSVLTGPLTHPVRAILPARTSEPQVRAVSLVIYVILWLASRVALAALVNPRVG